MQFLDAGDLKDEKVTALIYGPPGIGKTTLLGTLPGKTLVIDVDKGCSVLKGRKGVKIKALGEDLDGLKESLEYLQQKCEFDNVCVDSLSELERSMLTIYGRKGDNDGAPELGHYLRAQYKLMDYCRLFRALPANVIFTAWETADELTASTGEKYTRSRPLIAAKIVDNVCGLCDVVGRLAVSDKEETAGERFIRLTGGTTYIAKDRIGKRQYCKFEELI
jgi:phage nucleotide-binding protein